MCFNSENIFIFISVKKFHFIYNLNKHHTSIHICIYMISILYKYARAHTHLYIRRESVPYYYVKIVNN